MRMSASRQKRSSRQGRDWTHRRPRVQRVHYLTSVNNGVVLRARWVELHQAYLESSKPSDTRTKAFASEDDYRLQFQSLQFDLRGGATSTSDLTIFACGSNWSVASSESGFNAAGLGDRMKDVAVVSYCRTGIAKAGRGALNQTHGIPMAAHVLRNAVKRARIDPGEVEDVILGCGLPEGATGHNIARNAALEAGFGVGTPGVTINRYCGSGITAASMAANRIATGEADILIAGGVESISLVQFNLNMNGFFYEPLAKRMPAVWWTMNQTADFVAKKYNISREALDTYVVESQKRVAAAIAAGKYAAEIVPLDAALTSLEAKVGVVQADARDTANKALADLRKNRDGFWDTVKRQTEANEAAWI